LLCAVFLFLVIRPPPTPPPFPYTTLFRSPTRSTGFFNHNAMYEMDVPHAARVEVVKGPATALYGSDAIGGMVNVLTRSPEDAARSEEHTSELQSRENLVCRLLLEKKKYTA